MLRDRMMFLTSLEVIKELFKASNEAWESVKILAYLSVGGMGALVQPFEWLLFPLGI